LDISPYAVLIPNLFVPVFLDVDSNEATLHACFLADLDDGTVHNERFALN
jgi:hypothetical protein